MAEKTWTVELPEVAHSEQQAASFAPRKSKRTITVNHNYWTTKRKIAVDGQSLAPENLRSYGIYGQGSDDLFPLDGHTAHLHIRSVLSGYKYDLAVDGRSIATGQPVTPWPQTMAVQPGANTAVPLWSWLFVLPLLLAGFVGQLSAGWLVLTINKSTPSSYVLAIGLILAGFHQIQSIARDHAKPTNTRLIQSLGVCGLVAVGVFALDVIVGLIFH
jgi:hypothetical protein